MVVRIDGGAKAFGRIEALAFDGQFLYTYDYDDRALEAFDLRGRERWQLDGSSPGAIAIGNASDLEVDGHRQLWVVDSRGQQVDVLSSAGVLTRAIRGPRSIVRVAPRSDGTFWGFTPVDTTPSLYTADGHRLAHLHLSPAIERADFVAREPSLTALGDGGLVIAYRWSDRFVVGAAGPAPWREYRGVDRREFPRDVRRPRTINGTQLVQLLVDPSNPTSALSADVDGGIFYDLFGVGAKASGQQFRTLDCYDTRSGRYVGSYQLPAEAEAIRVRGRLFAAIVPAKPWSIIVWKWTPAR